jgi:hypothetical protein
MDSLFDDDQDEVGSEIEAYCPSPRCKADTNHTVISMYEDEIRRVQCQVCGDVHAYRKPRGDAVEAHEGAAAERKKLSRKPSWDEAMGQVTEQDLASCRPYSIRDTYEEMDVVSHPKFGTGFVTELLPDNKVEITFKDERRVLVHNRSDLAQKMPELAEMPAPRDLKKRKRRKKGQSELASRLFGDTPGVIDTNPETMAAKLAAAQRAAEEKRVLALQMVATGAGLDESQLTPAQRRERKRLEREAEKQRKAAEREAEKQKKLAAREAEKQRKAAEKAKLKVQQEKEKAKKKAQAERDKAKKKAQAERDKARKLAQAERDREKKKLQAEREREKKKLQAERERERKQEQAERQRETARKKAELAKKAKAAKAAAIAKKEAAKKKAEQLKKAKAAKAAAIAKKKEAAKKKAEQLKKAKAAKAAAVAKKKAAALAKKKKLAAAGAKKSKAAAATKPKGKKLAAKKPAARKPAKKKSGRR